MPRYVGSAGTTGWKPASPEFAEAILRIAMYAMLASRLARYRAMIRAKGLRKALGQLVSLERVFVPVVKDLTELPDKYRLTSPLDGLRFIEAGSENHATLGLSYPVASRSVQAVENLAKGYRACIVAAGDTVVGDIWYAECKHSHHRNVHPDVALLHLAMGAKDVYLFDMYVDPAQRGKNTATALMGRALWWLSEAGYTIAYGYFEADNVPAMWVHRLLKYRELPRLRIGKIGPFKWTRDPIQT